MERKTKHRILGIFVVIGLIIILLPFFQSGKEPQIDAELMKPPAFPDQAVQVSTSEVAPIKAPAIQQPDDTINTNKTSVTAEAPNMTTPAPVTADSIAPVTTSEKTINKTEDSATKANTIETKTTPAVPTEKGKVAELTPTPSSKSVDDITQMSDETSSIDSVAKKPDPTTEKKEHVVSAEKQDTKPIKIASSSKKIMKLAKYVRNPKIIAAYKKLPIENNGLFKLKSAAWVVQVGDFKNKTHALRLVNQLRASGYRAFIQQINTSLGNNTRVFIGPENKQTSARDLASQLETDMHLHGIVISYKPLAL